jgi:branched-subunit amino acid permease
MEHPQQKLDLTYWIEKYFLEILEAIVALSIVQLLLHGSIDVVKVIKPAMIIAIVTSLIETYNPAYRNALKNSIFVTGVTSVIAGV